MPDIPEEIKDRFDRVTAEFMKMHDVPFDDVTEFIMDIIQIYEDYIRQGIKEGRWIQ